MQALKGQALVAEAGVNQAARRYTKRRRGFYIRSPGDRARCKHVLPHASTNPISCKELRMNPVAAIWDQIVALWLANKVAFAAAALSVAGAVGTAFLTYLGGSRLERRKAALQGELEQRKAGLQGELETRKSGLQGELEVRKAGLQRELEDFKASRQEELERRKAVLQGELQKDLEQFRSDILAETSLRNARLAYEFDARKRLYAKVEPLLFQLFDAAEGAYHGVASLARTAKRGELIWLAREGYFEPGARLRSEPPGRGEAQGREPRRVRPPGLLHR
jgi:hypothetical protein